jgi:hypothetical protein
MSAAIELLRELGAAVDRINVAFFDRLRALGIPPAAYLAGEWYGAARIQRIEGGLYEPVEADEGEAALLLPARDPTCVVVDLVAVPLAEPSRWATRRGVVGVLGLDRADYAAWMNEPLRLARTPFAWFAAGSGAGTCLLDPRCWEARRILAEAHALIAEDETHAAELYKLQRRPEKRRFPPVRFAKEAAA